MTANARECETIMKEMISVVEIVANESVARELGKELIGLRNLAKGSKTVELSGGTFRAYVNGNSYESRVYTFELRTNPGATIDVAHQVGDCARHFRPAIKAIVANIMAIWATFTAMPDMIDSWRRKAEEFGDRHYKKYGRKGETPAEKKEEPKARVNRGYKPAKKAEQKPMVKQPDVKRQWTAVLGWDVALQVECAFICWRDNDGRAIVDDVVFPSYTDGWETRRKVEADYRADTKFIQMVLDEHKDDIADTWICDDAAIVTRMAMYATFDDTELTFSNERGTRLCTIGGSSFRKKVVKLNATPFFKKKNH